MVPEFGRWRQGDQKFKIILAYTVNSWPVLDTWNAVSKEKKRNAKIWFLSISHYFQLKTKVYETKDHG